MCLGHDKSRPELVHYDLTEHSLFQQRSLANKHISPVCLCHQSDMFHGGKHWIQLAPTCLSTINHFLLRASTFGPNTWLSPITYLSKDPSVFPYHRWPTNWSRGRIPSRSLVCDIAESGWEEECNAVSSVARFHSFQSYPCIPLDGKIIVHLYFVSLFDACGKKERKENSWSISCHKGLSEQKNVLIHNKLMLTVTLFWLVSALPLSGHKGIHTSVAYS